MSHDIHILRRTLQLLAGQDGDPSALPDSDAPETPIGPARGENGEVYFELDWQTRRANDRQQQAVETFQDDGFPTDQGDDGATFPDFRQTSSDASSPRQSSATNPPPDADGNHLYQTEPNINNYSNNNSTNANPNNYASSSYANNGANNYSANNYANNGANNFLNDNQALNWLRNQPENLRARIIQMSEPRTVEIRMDGRIEMRQISRFDELAQKMELLKLTPQEFAKTLPREEREAFLARFQLTQTSNGERSPQTAIEKNVAENKQTQFAGTQIQGEKLVAQTAAQQTKTVGNLPARATEENTFGATLPTASNKSADAPNNIVLANKSLNAPPEANLKTANGATNFVSTENFNARVLNNNRAENSLVVNVLTRREAGEILGGALISGALAAVGEHEQTENYRVGDAYGNEKYYGAGASGFAAGATGALLSAAIGRVIPGAGTDVSGVLGFVSGVVVGVEINEGLRWLGASNSMSGATAYESNRLSENSAVPNFSLQTRFA